MAFNFNELPIGVKMEILETIQPCLSLGYKGVLSFRLLDNNVVVLSLNKHANNVIMRFPVEDISGLILYFEIFNRESMLMENVSAFPSKDFVNFYDAIAATVKGAISYVKFDHSIKSRMVIYYNTGKEFLTFDFVEYPFLAELHENVRNDFFLTEVFANNMIGK